MILEVFSYFNNSMIFAFYLQYNSGFELQAHFKARDRVCKVVFIANNILISWRPP